MHIILYIGDIFITIGYLRNMLCIIDLHDKLQESSQLFNFRIVGVFIIPFGAFLGLLF